MRRRHEGEPEVRRPARPSLDVETVARRPGPARGRRRRRSGCCARRWRLDSRTRPCRRDRAASAAISWKACCAPATMKICCHRRRCRDWRADGRRSPGAAAAGRRDRRSPAPGRGAAPVLGRTAAPTAPSGRRRRPACAVVKRARLRAGAGAVAERLDGPSIAFDRRRACAAARAAPAAARPGRSAIQRVADEGAGADPRLDQALGDQPVEGLDDRGARHARAPAPAYAWPAGARRRQNAPSESDRAGRRRSGC